MTVPAKKETFSIFTAHFPSQHFCELNWADSSPVGLNCRNCLLNNAGGASRGECKTLLVYAARPLHKAQPPSPLPRPQYYGAEHTLCWWVTCGSAGSWRGSNQCNDTAGDFSLGFVCSLLQRPVMTLSYVAAHTPLNKLSPFPCTAPVFAYIIVFKTNVEDVLCFFRSWLEM